MPSKNKHKMLQKKYSHFTLRLSHLKIYFPFLMVFIISGSNICKDAIFKFLVFSISTSHIISFLTISSLSPSLTLVATVAMLHDAGVGVPELLTAAGTLSYCCCASINKNGS